MISVHNTHIIIMRWGQSPLIKWNVKKVGSFIYGLFKILQVLFWKPSQFWLNIQSLHDDRHVYMLYKSVSIFW